MKARLTKLFTLLTILTLGITQLWAADDVYYVMMYNSITEAGALTSSSSLSNGIVKYTSSTGKYASSTDITVTGMGSSKSSKYNNSSISNFTTVGNWAAGSGTAYAAGAKFTTLTIGLGTKHASSIKFIGYRNTSSTSDMTIGGTKKTTAKKPSTYGSDCLLEWTGDFTGDVSVSATGEHVGVFVITVPASATKHTVTYKAGDGTGDDVVDSDAKTVKAFADCSFTAPTGYEFKEWQDGSSNVVAEGATVSADMTLTAIYRLIPTKYTVTYDLNGASGDAPTETDKAEGDVFNLAAAPSWAGHAFDGWLCSADAAVKAAGASYTMTAANTTFTAQWKKAPTVLYHYQQSNLSENLAAGSYTATGGSLITSASMSKESASYNAAVPTDLKGGANVGKLGSNAAYIQISLTSGKFLEGDTVHICGYKPYKISKTTDLSGEITTSIATGTAKTDYNVGTVVLPAGVEQGSLYLSRAEGTGTGFAAVKVVRPVKYAVNFAAGTGASGSMAAKEYPAGAEVTLPECTFTAPTDQEFDAWTSSDVTITAGKFTMPANDVTITATWKAETPKYTVTYVLNGASGDAPTSPSKAAGDVFSLAAAPAWAAHQFDGWECNIDGVTYAAEASYTMTAAATTFTAQWTQLAELEDTYVWKKGSGYTGCVTSPNADAPAAQFTTVDVDGMDAMTSGRASSAGTTVTVTITSVQAGYAIKSICTYGKLEESAGAQISWDGGANWENLAAYSEQARTFNAPLATFPTSFKIKFISASTSSGGLWWRNALVTLEQIKTIASTTDALQNVKVNGTAIDAANLATLQSTHSLDLADEYVSAPTVSFVKRTTVTFTDASSVYSDEDVDVVATVNADKWEASTTINAIVYTVTLAKPTVPALSVSVSELTLTSAKNATDTKTFTFSGDNLGTTDVTIALASAVEGMTVSPAVVSPVAGVITNQEVTVTYQSLVDVAAADVNLIVRYSDEVKQTVVLHYSSTAGYGALVDVTGSTTWDFSKAAPSANVTISNSEVTILANYDVENDPSTIKTDNIEVKGERVTKTSNVRVHYLHFHTTVAGILTLQYSNTGGNAARGVYVNGTLYDEEGSANTTKKGLDNAIFVPAGDVVLEAKELSTGDLKNVQLYQMIFTAKAGPDYTRTEMLGDGVLGTICVDHNVVAGGAQGATFYELVGKNDIGKIVFDEVISGQLVAGVPYVFQAHGDNIALYYGATEVTEPDNSGALKGTFTGETFSAEKAAEKDIYFFRDHALWSAKKTGLQVLANRAWLEMGDVNPIPNPNPAPGRRRITLGVNGTNVATGLEDLEVGEAPMKVMMNGQLFILRGEKIYDATGRLVK